MEQDIDAIKQSLTNYTILHQIGQSQTADVYLAEHTFLQTRVAVKLYHQPLSIEETTPFEQRIHKIASLHHPHIVRLLEYTLLAGCPCLVTDFAAHGTLRDRYPRGSQLALSDIALHVEQIASALQYIHAQNIVHGDLKPENLLLNEDDKTLLNDFDLLPATTQSQSEEIIGTIQYMAPEQFNGYLYPASDQYALAVLIWEWLTGTLLFQGTYTEIAAQHLHSMPPPLCAKRSDIPRTIEGVLRMALAKKSDERFSSVVAFANVFIQECRTALSEAGQATLLPPDPSGALSASTRRPEAPTLLAAQEVALMPTILSLSGVEPTQQADSLPSTTDQAMQISTVLSPDRPSTRRRLLLAGLALGVGTLALGGGLELLNWRTSLSRNISQVRQKPATPTPVAPGTLLYTYTYQGYIQDLIWSPDGAYMAIRVDDNIYLWPIEHTTKTVKLVGTQKLGLIPQWSPDSKLLVSSKLNQPIVMIWDAGTGQVKTQWSIPQINSIDDITWLSNNRQIRLISYNEDNSGNILNAYLQVWDITTQSMIQSSNLDISLGQYAGFSPNGLYALVFPQNSALISVVSTQTGKALATIEPAGANIQDISWSRDSNSFAIMVGHVYIFDTQTGKAISQSEDSDTILPGYVQLSPDGKYAAFTNDKMVVVSNTATGKTLLRYYGHTNSVLTLAWSPDGKYLATACANSDINASNPPDRTVQVWRAVK